MSENQNPETMSKTFQKQIEKMQIPANNVELQWHFLSKYEYYCIIL